MRILKLASALIFFSALTCCTTADQKAYKGLTEEKHVDIEQRRTDSEVQKKTTILGAFGKHQCTTDSDCVTQNECKPAGATGFVSKCANDGKSCSASSDCEVKGKCKNKYCRW
jgi:hypothetical protein